MVSVIENVKDLIVFGKVNKTKTTSLYAVPADGVLLPYPLEKRRVGVLNLIILQRTSTSLWGEWMGVMHGDEIEYVFGHPLNMSLQFNSRERELSLKIMQAFARFSATGKPVTDDVNWPLYTKDQPQYFVFNADKNGIGKGPRAQACAFWNHFLPKLRDNS
ncbi:hypothetical protein NQ315_008555, partial [Exocentrus adspersus]